MDKRLQAGGYICALHLAVTGTNPVLTIYVLFMINLILLFVFLIVKQMKIENNRMRQWSAKIFELKTFLDIAKRIK